MNQLFRKLILIILIIGTFLFTGCSKFSFGTFDSSKEEEVKSDVSAIPTIEASGADINSSETGDADSNSGTGILPEGTTVTQVPIQPNANDDLTVYSVDSETGDIEPVTALIPKGSKITPQLIVDTVVESMADQSINIGIDSVTTEDDKVIVSFIKDKAPYSDMGSGYEAAILDAIAQSLIDNLKDYRKVIYRVEGKAYVSGVFEFGIDEVYLGDN